MLARLLRCDENGPSECRCIVRQKRVAYGALVGELLMPGENELHPVFQAELRPDADFIAAQVRRFAAGEPLRNVVAG